eukprot:SM000350S13028  [mRNA]  locus=s350:73396:74059:+ [translate_table: standard]
MEHALQVIKHELQHNKQMSASFSQGLLRRRQGVRRALGQEVMHSIHTRRCCHRSTTVPPPQQLATTLLAGHSQGQYLSWERERGTQASKDGATSSKLRTGILDVNEVCELRLRLP